MIDLLVILAYAAIFTLLVGGAVYLFITRKRGGAPQISAPVSKEALALAEQLAGKYSLSDLEKILVDLGAIGAWGVVVELDLLNIKDIVQMALDADKVELYSHNNGVIPDYLEKYRRSVERAGLVIRNVGNTEDVFSVEIVGPWPHIASVLRQVVEEIYGVHDHAEFELTVFE